MRDLLSAPGTHAERIALDADAVAPAPRSIPLEVAATLPLNALTADKSLHLSAARPGDSILITGAAGGVGGFAVQLATMRGIATVAAVRPGGADRARQLGATHVVTTDQLLAAAVRSVVPGGVDSVIDAAALVDFGALDVPAPVTFPFADAAGAHALVQRGGLSAPPVLVPDVLRSIAGPDSHEKSSLAGHVDSSGSRSCSG